MYQVLFAEDELLVRLGLQKAIPWENFHMQLAAQADNGIQAFELFQSVRPDVVITDICMAGMDGYELIQKIREIDGDCAIIVISCLEDFETLRKMIPYKIIGYIAKAGMSLEDVHKLLQEAKEYLDKIGRPDRQQGRAEKSVEEQLVRYFTEDGAELSWSGQADIRELLLFSIEKEDREKVNDLTMRFLGELMQRELPGSVVVQVDQRNICVLIPEREYPSKEGKEKIQRLVKGFLGITLKVNAAVREENETLKEAYCCIQSQSAEHTGGNQLIEDAMRYIQKNYKNSIGLNEISDVLGISPGYFSSLFRKETGKTYVEYLNEIRLKEAARELLGGDDKLAVIAENTGFNNVEYFCRMFKKYTGLSPAKWREKNK